MRKYEFIISFFLFQIIDEKNTIIYDKVHFNKIPFVFYDILIENMDCLLKGESILIENKLKNFYIRIKDIEKVPKMTLEEIKTFYLNNLSISEVINYPDGDFSLIEQDEILGLPTKILSSNTVDNELISMSFYDSLSLRFIQPLVFLDCDCFNIASQLCY